MSGSRRSSGTGLGLVVLVAMCLVGGLILFVSMHSKSPAKPAADVTTSAPVVEESAGPGALPTALRLPPKDACVRAQRQDWCGIQIKNASTIVDEGLKMGIPLRGLQVAIGTAMQESHITNYASEVVPESKRYAYDAVDATPDHKSVGIFQQQYDQGWGGGDISKLMDPRTSAHLFFDKLKKVTAGWKNWQDAGKVRMTDIAQAVQNSGFPEAYQKWETDAVAVVNYVLGFPA